MQYDYYQIDFALLVDKSIIILQRYDCCGFDLS